jgi:hypothetical protein
MTKFISLALLTYMLSVAAQTCETRCQKSACHGCLADNNICGPTLSQSECFAHSWCWCGGCGPSLAKEDCKAWQSVFVRDIPGSVCSRGDPCACGGATCDPAKRQACVLCEGGRIINMNLNGGLKHFPPGSLASTIPSELALLPAIVDLGFSNCSFTGTIPSELGQLTSLTGLNFGRNNLTGTVPPSLGQLTALTSLHLWGNKLTGSIPELPFAHLTEVCDLDRPTECTEEMGCNHFKCPLPADATQCNGWGGVGVHCE